MDKYKKLFEKNKYILFLVLLLVSFVASLSILSIGWYTLLIVVLPFSIFGAYLIRKDSTYSSFVNILNQFLKKYIPGLVHFSLELVLFIVLFIFTYVFFLNKKVSVQPSELTYEEDVSYTDSTPPVTETQSVDFYEGRNYGRLWVGNMFIKKFAQQKSMFVTYTFDFNFRVNDDARSVTKVEVVGISASTSLPNGNLKILPFAHADYSTGSVIENLKHEDWNTYGYTYSEDYKKMASLGTTYTPNICENDVYCDFLDEVGQKGGSMSLRFKYLNVGKVLNDNPGLPVQTQIDAFGVTPSQLSGNFSWKLIVTLDDGSVQEHTYSVAVNGDSLNLSESNTVGFEKF